MSFLFLSSFNDSLPATAASLCFYLPFSHSSLSLIGTNLPKNTKNEIIKKRFFEHPNPTQLIFFKKSIKNFGTSLFSVAFFLQRRVVSWSESPCVPLNENHFKKIYILFMLPLISFRFLNLTKVTLLKLLFTFRMRRRWSSDDVFFCAIW